jgi:hypothetical protein
MSKVQSGTFAVIYEMPNARQEDMATLPMMQKLIKASPLLVSDLRPSRLSMQFYGQQSIANIFWVLCNYVPGFTPFQDLPGLQNVPRCKRPAGHKTKFFPLRASTIEEASITGNLLVHDDIYLVQLLRSPSQLDKFAIPAINDQLTNSRIRSAQSMRSQDLTPWTRREVFQLAFGLFHLTMNLIWALLHVHRGTINQHGSLSHLFVIPEKVRLGSDRPDYHTLLAALMQVLDGLLLNAWRKECGFSSLADFAKSTPSLEVLIETTRNIMRKYATPTQDTPPIEKPSARNPQNTQTRDFEAETSDSESEDELLSTDLPDQALSPSTRHHP